MHDRQYTVIGLKVIMIVLIELALTGSRLGGWNDFMVNRDGVILIRRAHLSLDLEDIISLLFCSLQTFSVFHLFEFLTVRSILI